MQLIKSGLKFMRHGKICYLGEVRSAHQQLAIHADDGDMAIVSPDVFRREVVDGSILMLVPDKHGILHPVSEGWKESETEKARKRRSDIHRVLEHADQCQLKGIAFKDMSATIKSFCMEHRIDRPPTERTLRYWRAKSRGHESMTSPRWHLSGNRYQGPTPLLLESIKEVMVKELRLLRDRFKMSDAWNDIQAVYDVKWREVHGDDSRPPCHSIRQLRNFMRMMPWSDVLRLQLDGRTRSAITRVAINPHTASKLFDAVEMDATVLDVLICDQDGKEIGRPTLYVAIDTATGYPLGLYLTIQKPSNIAFVECLRYMLFPKDADFDSRYGIKNRIEVFGKPILLRVDNGSEFVSKVAEAVVYQVFGDTARCKPYTPQEKPHVESFNGTLRQFVLTLNGATTSTVTGEQRLIRKDEQLMQIEQLRTEIYQWVYDKYALRVNNMRSMLFKTAVAPIDCVREALNTITLPVPVSRKSFERDIAFFSNTRSLGHEGIQFQGWSFHSNELAALYLKHGPGRYKFRYSAIDATAIFVLPPDGMGEPVVAFNKQLKDIGVDFATARVIRKHVLAEGKELNRRTFEYDYKRHLRQLSELKTSAGRAKHARASEMVDAAAEQMQKTMTQYAPVEAADEQPAAPAASTTTNAHSTKAAPQPATVEKSDQKANSQEPVQASQNLAPRGRRLGESK